MKKVLVLLAEGFEDIEALTIVDVLRRAEVKVTLCTIKEYYVKSSHDVIVRSEELIEYVRAEDYDALFLPGGLPGAYNLRDDDRVIKIIQEMNELNKLIFAICAAPIILSKAGITKDRKVTSYPGFEDQIKCSEYLEDPIVVDRKVTTSRGPATALLLAYEMLNQLGYEEKSKELSKGMLFDYLKEKI